MYFCYIDESGDGGAFDIKMPGKTGSPYFILCGLIVHSNKWRSTLDTLKSYRKKIAAQAYLPANVEFHCSEMIDPHKVKVFKQISIPDRWRLISEFAGTIGQHIAFSIIAVVIDKAASTIAPTDYLTTSLSKLYQAYDDFLKTEKENGIVIFDRASEKTITTHVRKLTGTSSDEQTIPGIKIGRVIEDPIFRVSTDSLFIQAADVVAFTLKERESPLTARKKFNADRIFTKQLAGICIHPVSGDEEGIIRI